ncbi:hypothetical protein BD310DRAFT_917298 [Dichomitus squalens]|uniref:Uncharacterized protein n=1 Tax=Dichomitus squalens TaxID=114155 RepID=A0A4Q9Q794_9APHY|nr:hypothetical protein BD310DRAFT_917298 [Dichomitus squalens]
MLIISLLLVNNFVAILSCMSERRSFTSHRFFGCLSAPTFLVSTIWLVGKVQGGDTPHLTSGMVHPAWQAKS